MFSFNVNPQPSKRGNFTKPSSKALIFKNTNLLFCFQNFCLQISWYYFASVIIVETERQRKLKSAYGNTSYSWNTLIGFYQEAISNLTHCTEPVLTTQHNEFYRLTRLISHNISIHPTFHYILSKSHCLFQIQVQLQLSLWSSDSAAKQMQI